jgi:P-type Ca2+ transporter type 2C
MNRNQSNGAEKAKENFSKWHLFSANEIVEKLNSNVKLGLTDDQVKTRIDEIGLNQLKEAPKTSIWALLWAQFNDFVVWLLIGAAGISAVLGEWVETSAIMAIVVLNAALGIVQEKKAQEALAALKAMSAPEANVLRDGHRVTVQAKELVPGDIVLLEAGNYIPADVRLLETINLQVEEAALTGESVPVQKNADAILRDDASLGDRINMAFMGTLVSYGRGLGIVSSTGMQTEIGLIATLLQSVEDEETPLQRRLDQLGKTLGWGALTISALVFVFGAIRGSDMLEMFLIAVSLAIAAVPEGLPAIVTISLALGMREMISRNALIRKLSSVETLGSATIIGSDKTGTLTQNEMTITQIWVDSTNFGVTGSGYNPVGDFEKDGKKIALKDYPALTTSLWVGVLNNNAILEIDESDSGKEYKMIGNPTEGAMIVAAAKADSKYLSLQTSYPREQELPFDSNRKQMTTIHQVINPKKEDISPFVETGEKKAWHVVAVKGAPDVILKECVQYQKMDDSYVPLTEAKRKEILAANDAMASQALRVIAVAYRLDEQFPEEVTPENLEKDLIFVGLLGIIDPPREEVKIALAQAKKAGIRTVMITGDYPQTAQAIAAQIGLLNEGHQVLTGYDLNDMSDEVLRREITTTDVFARVTPEHKVRIVRALRANGHIVAMTGDGVNDAPALKQSDIGVAMGITGTDVAKETADMVLTDDNYSSIVSAIEQGRVIYSNIRKFVFYLLSCNLAEIAIIFLAIVGNLPSPLNPIQLLWLNLVTDGAPALALGMEKGDPDIMLQKPRPSDEPIINKMMKLGIMVQTIAITAVTLGAYLIGLKLWPEATGEFNKIAATMAFITLSFSELIRAFTARSERFPILKIGLWKNKTMNWAVISSSLLLLMVLYVPFFNPIFETVPLAWAQWKYLIPLLFVPGIAAEITKAYISKKGL